MLVTGGLSIELWDAETGELITELLGHQGAVTCFAFSLDSSLLVSGSSDGTLKLWDIDAALRSGISTDSWRGTRARAISPQGTSIASAADDGTVKLWDAVDAKEIGVIGEHLKYVSACRFSPDGRRFASASFDGNIHLSVIGSSKRLTLPIRYPCDCRFTPDGSLLVGGSMNGTMTLWNTADGREIKVFRAHLLDVDVCAFSPAGDRIVSASEDNTLKLWDAVSCELLGTMMGDGYVPAPEHISRDADGEAVGSPVGPMMGDALFSPEGSRILSRATGVEAPEQASLKLWDTATCTELAKLAPDVFHINDCAFSPDGTRVVVASDDGKLRLVDASTGSVIFNMTGHDDRVFTCSFSPDALWILSVSADATLKLWEAATGAEVCTYSSGSGRLDALWYPDASRLAVSTDEGLHIVKLENYDPGPIVINPWRSRDRTLAAGCAFCLTWSEIPQSALGHEWRCHKCATRFQLNSLPIEGEWRPVASAWALVVS